MADTSDMTVNIKYAAHNLSFPPAMIANFSVLDCINKDSF